MGIMTMQHARPTTSTRLRERTSKAHARAIRLAIGLLATSLCAMGTLTLPLHAQSTVGPSGTAFHAAFMHTYYPVGTAPLRRLVIESEQPTVGVVAQPQRGLSIAFSVVPGAATVLDFPPTYVDSVSQVVGNSGLYITSTLPITVSLHILHYSTQAVSEVLPLEALGNDHIIMSYPGFDYQTTVPSEFILVGTEDSTTVDIMLPDSVLPLQVILDANETFLFQASDSDVDLTGTRITSASPNGCGKLAVFAGTSCAFVPVSCWACDLLMQQMPPVSHLGTLYFTMPPDSADAYGLKILALNDGTVVDVDGNVFNLSAGQWQMDSLAIGHKAISSNLPIMVAQFMLGRDCAGYGDPSMLVLHPFASGTMTSLFDTAPVAGQFGRRIGLVTDSSNAGAVLLDGTPIPATLYQAYPGYPGHVFVDVPVDSGSHVLVSAMPFLGHTYGWGFASSYDLGLGAVHTPFGAVSDDTLICHAGGPLLLQAPPGLAQPIWFPEGYPGDTLSTQPTFTPTPVSDTVLVVAEYGEPCSFFRFRVELPMTSDLLATASPAVICEGDTTMLEAALAPAVPATMHWSPGNDLADPNATSTAAFPDSSTWYHATASSPGLCWSTGDSVFVMVNTQPPDFNVIQNGAEICAGSVGPWTYQWYLDGDSIVGANGQCVDILATGTYSVVLDAGNGCTSTSSGYFLVDGLQETSEGVKWSLSSTGTLLLFVPDGTQVVQLFDAAGRAVFTLGSGQRTDGMIELDMSRSGFYVLQVLGSGWSRTARVVLL